MTSSDALGDQLITELRAIGISQADLEGEFGSNTSDGPGLPHDELIIAAAAHGLLTVYH